MDDETGDMYDMDASARDSEPAPGHAGVSAKTPRPEGASAEPPKPLGMPGKKKGEYSSTVEKGTEFELQVAEMFRAHGYRVTHNVTMVGKSKAPHQIDVLAEYVCPLHTSRIIVEAKAYSHHISKDIIMKLADIMRDLGMDRAVLATTTDFSSGAVTTAQQYNNLEMWDGDKIKRFMARGGMAGDGIPGATKRFIPAKADGKKIRRNAAKSAKRRSGGVIFGRGRPRESVAATEIVSYPYLDVSIQTNVTRVEKTGWRRRESVTRTVVNHVTLDGRTGALADFTKNGPSYRYAYLDSMSDDEMAVLRAVAGKRTFGRQDVTASGLSSGAASSALLRMAGNGIVRQAGTKPAKYSAMAPFPASPVMVGGIEGPFGKGMIDRDPGNRVIDIRVQAGGMEEKLARYWNGCRVVSIEQVYYPFYDVRYESDDGNRRNEMIDGITGRPQKYLARVMAGGDDNGDND